MWMGSWGCLEGGCEIAEEVPACIPLECTVSEETYTHESDMQLCVLWVLRVRVEAQASHSSAVLKLKEMQSVGLYL